MNFGVEIARKKRGNENTNKKIKRLVYGVRGEE